VGLYVKLIFRDAIACRGGIAFRDALALADRQGGEKTDDWRFPFRDKVVKCGCLVNCAWTHG
jgi:hypothetical protein